MLYVTWLGRSQPKVTAFTQGAAPKLLQQALALPMAALCPALATLQSCVVALIG